MNITIIGTGYVGLVSGICFAEFGFNITCVDKEIKKIQKLQDGEVTIVLCPRNPYCSGNAGSFKVMWWWDNNTMQDSAILDGNL